MTTTSLGRVLSIPLLLGLALLGGCASQSGGASSPSGSASASGDKVVGDIQINKQGGRSTSAHLDGKDLTGPTFSLSVDKSAVRGSVGANTMVDLTLGGGRVEGRVGQGHTKLALTPQGAGGFQAQGLFAEQTVAFNFGPDALTGHIGPCTYDLRAQGAAPAGQGTGGSGGGVTTYSGPTSCGGQQGSSATFTVPPGFGSLSPEEQASILGFVLIAPGG